MHRWVWDLHYPAPTSTRHEYPIAAIPHDTPRYPLGPTVLAGNYTVRLTVDGKTSTASAHGKDGSTRQDVLPQVCRRNFRPKSSLASMVTSIVGSSPSRRLDSHAIREAELQTQRLQPKKRSQTFQKKLTALLGAPGGFFAPPSPEPTLSSRERRSQHVYISKSGSPMPSPPSAQMEASASADRSSSDLLKRWNES